MLQFVRAVLYLTIFTITIDKSAHGEMPVFFRHDNGVATDAKQSLPDDFEEKKHLAWKAKLQPGISSPCIVGNSIFLTSYDAESKQLETVALDRATGKIKWKRAAPAKKIESFHSVGSPASCTPASNGSRVFVFFGSFGLLCYDLDGKLIWSKKMGPFQDEFGASSSPILIDDLVILNEDHDVGSFLIAISQKTGETIWKTEREGFTRSYSTPIVIETNGKTEIVVAGSLQLTGYDPKDGSRKWWVSGLSRIVDTTPVFAGGLLYVATWTPGGDQAERISMASFADASAQHDKNKDGKIAKEELPEGPVLTRFFRIDLNQDGALDNGEWEKHVRVFENAQNVAIAVKPGGSGDVTKTRVKWIYRRGLPIVPSPIVYDGVLYMVKDSGIITSLDAKTGERLQQGRAAGRGNYYASIIAGDGKVFLASERGMLTVLKAGREWKIISQHDFGERIMATPVIKDGRIYVRTDAGLSCFEKR